MLAERRRDEGEGIVLGELTLGGRTVARDLPGGYWLHSRGVLPAAAWDYQRWHGRRWYQRKVVVVPAAFNENLATTPVYRAVTACSVLATSVGLSTAAFS